MREMATGGTPGAAYPQEFQRWARLEDGSLVFVRPIRPDDAPGLSALYTRLSRQSVYQRFFTVMPSLPPDWARELADVDYVRRLALVAERDGAHGTELLGVARYEPSEEPDMAEVALVVEDDWQGRGVGALLLDDLLAAAATRGIRRFCAWVLSDNQRMLTLLGRLTEVRERTTEDGIVRVVFTRR